MAFSPGFLYRVTRLQRRHLIKEFFMKDKVKLFGIIPFVFVIMLSMASCEILTPIAVSISGTPRVGQTITATSTGRGFDGNHGYEWSTSSSASGGWGYWTTGHGAGGSQCTVSGSIGNYIQARRYNKSTADYVYSNTIGPILEGY